MTKYKDFVWYDVDDDAYWIDDTDRKTIVLDVNNNQIHTQETCPIGWGSMAKFGGYKFMNIKI